MTGLIPFFLAVVCSIIGTTSELTNNDHNATDNAIYWDNSKLYNDNNIDSSMRQYDIKPRAKRETSGDPRCKEFEYKEGKLIRHPRELVDTKDNVEEDTYSSHTTCFTLIEAAEQQVIVLTFVDKFEMEDPVPRSDPPSCKHDYIEIRDGQFGYALPVYKFCGKEFPPSITSSGPFLWLKFVSDDSIQYSGFTIDVAFQPSATSRRLPNDCFMSITKQNSGVIDSLVDAKQCRALAGSAVDFQWKIETEADTQKKRLSLINIDRFTDDNTMSEVAAISTRYSEYEHRERSGVGVAGIIVEGIYLNFTLYKLAKPNECDANVVQVFGVEPNFDHALNTFCGSVPKSVTTKPGNGNIMYIRLFTKDKTSNVTAQFTAFRVMQQGEDECILSSEFNCLDGTCIDRHLQCDKVANCRLKADEDPALCTTAIGSSDNNPQMILIIFSVILSIMITVFLVKCVLKVYRDQKQINEYLSQGPLDKMAAINLSFDPIRMTMEPQPRASLERENQTNEMYKKQRNKQKSSSIESDSLRQSTSPDRSDWPESVPILPEDVRIEQKGRTRRDTDKREETLRSPKEEWNENKGVSFETPDTQDSECQTRDSLFQVDPVPSSGTNSRPNRGSLGFSGATVARPSSLRLSTVPTSPPPARPIGFAVAPISSHADRRPMSNETTRSAPDVIIVSKPI